MDMSNQSRYAGLLNCYLKDVRKNNLITDTMVSLLYESKKDIYWNSLKEIINTKNLSKHGVIRFKNISSNTVNYSKPFPAIITQCDTCKIKIIIIYNDKRYEYTIKNMKIVYDELNDIQIYINARDINQHLSTDWWFYFTFSDSIFNQIA